MPTQADYMRLAMAIDCEGCMDIHTHRQWREHLNRFYETCYVRISIANCDPRLAQWCKSLFGGNLSLNHKKPKNWRPTLAWYVTSKMAVEIIKNCLPYFILKREQAEVALAFQKTVFQVGCKGHSKATIQKRRNFQSQIKALKHAPHVTTNDKFVERVQ
jgi:hypothetical protein